MRPLPGPRGILARGPALTGLRGAADERSAGQRKRLALIAALLERKPVLVLDEWAADQDPQFKNIFYYELVPELKARGKTVIVISHDDRYFEVADRLIKLESGKLDYDKNVSQRFAVVNRIL